jgi:hypothetical protein
MASLTLIACGSSRRCSGRRQRGWAGYIASWHMINLRYTIPTLQCPSTASLLAYLIWAIDKIPPPPSERLSGCIASLKLIDRQRTMTMTVLRVPFTTSLVACQIWAIEKMPLLLSERLSSCVVGWQIIVLQYTTPTLRVPSTPSLFACQVLVIEDMLSLPSAGKRQTCGI